MTTKSDKPNQSAPRYDDVHADGVAWPSFGSIATLLSGLVASGEVQHCGAKKNRRYALASERRALRREARAA